MSDEKKVKLVVPKSLIVALWVAAIGLVLNGVQPFLPSPANAFGHIQKVAICDLVGGRCADVLPQVDERGIDYNALIMEQLDL